MKILLLALICLLASCNIQEKPFEQLYSNASDQAKEIFDQKEKYELQILFSPVTKKDGTVAIEHHLFNYDADRYFYPASSIKMPVAMLAVQKLRQLQSKGVAIDLDTPMLTDSLRKPQTSVTVDTTHNLGLPTLRQYIKKLFVVSDNDAYNRLYEFCGQDYINSELRAKKIFGNSRIVHRVGVSGFDTLENKYTPSIRFESEGKEHYVEPEKKASSNWWTDVEQTIKGKGYIDNEGNLVSEPFDFSHKNFVNVHDLQASLERLVYPELYDTKEQFDISIDDRTFLLESMRALPRDYDYLTEQSEEYYDSYVKFFMYGDSKERMPDHIKIANKIGLAYVNENQVYNDGVYEYDEVGIPFLAELGQLCYDYCAKQ